MSSVQFPNQGGAAAGAGENQSSPRAPAEPTAVSNSKKYMVIVSANATPKIMATETKSAKSSAKVIAEYLDSPHAAVDFVSADKDKLDRIEAYLNKGANKITNKAEKFVDSNLCRLPSFVKGTVKKVAIFLLEAKSAFKNSSGIVGLLSAKSDTVYYKEAKQKASQIRQNTSIIKDANIKLNSLDPTIKDLINKPGFKEDAKKIRDILLSDSLSDIEKMEQYQMAFMEAVSKYIKAEGADAKKLHDDIHSTDSDVMFAAMKKVISPEDTNNMNLAVLYSDTNALPELFNVIEGFNKNFNEITTPKENTEAALDRASHRESALQKLNTGVDIIKESVQLPIE